VKSCNYKECLNHRSTKISKMYLRQCNLKYEMVLISGIQKYTQNFLVWSILVCRLHFYLHAKIAKFSNLCSLLPAVNQCSWNKNKLLTVTCLIFIFKFSFLILLGCKLVSYCQQLNSQSDLLPYAFTLCTNSMNWHITLGFGHMAQENYRN
jgi:hypothetical protein